MISISADFTAILWEIRYESACNEW
ncbi:unnamed protein product, partial [Rotaria sordida]